MNAVEPTDREGRLAQRSNIEELRQAMDTEFGEGGIRDALNENGLEEYLLGGAYTRVLTLPAGVVIVSELWKVERLWLLIKGSISIKTEAGDQILHAPHISAAPFGSRAAIFTHSETILAAVTGAPGAEDLEEIEDMVLASDYDELTYPWDSIEE